ncbi:hypothetical protein OJAV_G00176200 [Oryzias javanicus]|uniref:Uncharacterized protein n=1 Tax=Oryzias javanicus TaxID=123683 RepID=A0A437CFW0_ORYJA|nr:hypothetical protein OJAV_G00176200 [Oryzias javanicus]
MLEKSLGNSWKAFQMRCVRPLPSRRLAERFWQQQWEKLPMERARRPAGEMGMSTPAVRPILTIKSQQRQRFLRSHVWRRSGSAMTCLQVEVCH